MPTFTVTKVKTFKGHDGQGFNATLMMDGKAICDVHDGAYGGGIEFTWLDLKNGRKHEEALIAHCKALPKRKNEFDNKLYEVTYEDLVYDLVYDQLQAKADAKTFKKFLAACCFKRPEDGRKGSYSIVKIPPTPENKKLLRAKYGDKIVFLDEHPKDWSKIIQEE